MSSPAWRRALLLLTTTTLFAFTCEAGLRLGSRVVQVYLAEMWRYGRAHKQFVSDARSHVHVPGTVSTVMGREVRINELGMRDRPFRPAPGKKQVLVLGDSITFGFGVDASETFSARLNEDVEGHEFWNAGVGNYNTAQETAAAAHYLPVVKPAALLLGFFLNDLEPTQRRPGSFFWENSLVFSLLAQIYWSLGGATSGDYLGYHRGLFRDHLPAWKQDVAKLAALAAGNGAQLQVLLIPELRGMRSRAFEAEYRMAEEVFRQSGAATCRGETLFPAEGAPDAREFWAAGDDTHPNAAAHKLLADSARKCFYGSHE